MRGAALGATKLVKQDCRRDHHQEERDQSETHKANLSKLDIRQRLGDELMFCESIRVYPDNLEVKVIGARPINVLCGDVGFKVPNCCCRRPDVTEMTPRTGGSSHNR